MTSFLVEVEKNSIVNVHHSLLTHLSAVGHLHWFQDLAVINSSAIDIGVHVFL